MRHAPFFVFVLTTVLATQDARADDVSGAGIDTSVRGLQLGAFVGYFVPAGSVGASGTPLNDVIPSSVPMGVEAGWRFNHLFYLGVATSWGPSRSPDSCNFVASCFPHDTQFVAEARLYLVRPERLRTSFDAWLSLGAGYDVIVMTISNQGTSGSTVLDGPIPIRFQFGLGVQYGGFEVGPYLGATLGYYVHRAINPPPPGLDTEAFTGEAYYWFGLGLRGSYRL
jgi:hypothetical protein